jgi:hypothetical protein
MNTVERDRRLRKYADEIDALVDQGRIDEAEKFRIDGAEGLSEDFAQELQPLSFFESKVQKVIDADMALQAALKDLSSLRASLLAIKDDNGWFKNAYFVDAKYINTLGDLLCDRIHQLREARRKVMMVRVAHKLQQELKWVRLVGRLSDQADWP